MAQKIEVITAKSKTELMAAVNDYMAKQAEADPRTVIELAGGVTCSADGTWIATVLHSATHKRSFEDSGG